MYRPPCATPRDGRAVAKFKIDANPFIPLGQCTRQMVYCIYIINRFGGLMYTRDFFAAAGAKIGINNRLVLAASLHSSFMMANKISPVKGCTRGIRTIITEKSCVACFQSLTGMYFILSGKPSEEAELHTLLPRVYRAYTDFVAKNAFSQKNQPIFAERFDRAVDALCVPKK